MSMAVDGGWEPSTRKFAAPHVVIEEETSDIRWKSTIAQGEFQDHLSCIYCTLNAHLIVSLQSIIIRSHIPQLHKPHSKLSFFFFFVENGIH